MALNQGDLSGSESVGGVRIDVHGNTVPLQGALNDAEKSTKKFADTADRELGGKANSAVGRFAEGLKKGVGSSIETFTGLIGKVTAVVGVFTLFYNIGRQVNDMLKTGADRAEEFSLGLDLSNQAAALDDTSKKIKKLESDLAGFEGQKALGRVIDRITGTTAESIKSEIAELRKIEKSLLESTEATRKRLNAKIASDQIIAFTEEQTKAELDGIELAQYERNKAIRTAEELRKKTTDAGLQDDLDRSIKTIQRIYEKKVETILAEEQQQRAALSRAEREAIASAERQAAALQRAISSAFDSIRQQQTNGLDRLTVTVERIAQIINRIESSRR